MNKICISGHDFEVGVTYKIEHRDLHNGFTGKLTKISEHFVQGYPDAHVIDVVNYYSLYFDVTGSEVTLDSDLVMSLIEYGNAKIEVVGDQEESPVKIAVQFALDGMFTDGGHHKQWYLNQILKTLLTPEEYAAKVIDMAPDYGWDEGIAP